jgi:hypothetical protein
MKKFHLAIGVTDIDRSVEDYSHRLGYPPALVIPNEYALWRTTSLNLSIRYVDQNPGTLRHLGWEDESASSFTQDMDINGIVWEHFSAELQAKEISDIWPQAKYRPSNT